MPSDISMKMGKILELKISLKKRAEEYQTFLFHITKILQKDLKYTCLNKEPQPYSISCLRINEWFAKWGNPNKNQSM